MLAWCRAEKDRALETLRLVKTEGWTFHETRGFEPMRDVTADRIRREKEVVRRMDKFIDRYEA